MRRKLATPCHPCAPGNDLQMGGSNSTEQYSIYDPSRIRKGQGDRPHRGNKENRPHEFNGGRDIPAARKKSPIRLLGPQRHLSQINVKPQSATEKKESLETTPELTEWQSDHSSRRSTDLKTPIRFYSDHRSTRRTSSVNKDYTVKPQMSSVSTMTTVTATTEANTQVTTKRGQKMHDPTELRTQGGSLDRKTPKASTLRNYSTTSAPTGGLAGLESYLPVVSNETFTVPAEYRRKYMSTPYIATPAEYTHIPSFYSNPTYIVTPDQLKGIPATIRPARVPPPAYTLSPWPRAPSTFRANIQYAVPTPYMRTAAVRNHEIQPNVKVQNDSIGTPVADRKGVQSKRKKPARRSKSDELKEGGGKNERQRPSSERSENDKTRVPSPSKNTMLKVVDDNNEKYNAAIESSGDELTGDSQFFPIQNNDTRTIFERNIYGSGVPFDKSDHSTYIPSWESTDNILEIERRYHETMERYRGNLWLAYHTS